MKPVGLFRGLMLGVVMMCMLLSIGCVRSINPILKPDQLTYDKVLLGRWVMVDKNGQSDVDVTLQPGAENQYLVIKNSKDTQGKGNMVGHLGKVQDHLIFELTVDPQDITAEGVDKGYADFLLPTYYFMVLDKYSATTAEVRILSIQWLEEYLKAHPDELKVQKITGSSDSFIITSTTEELQAFLLKHMDDPNALSEAIQFVRPGDPSTQPADAATKPADATIAPAK